MSRSLLRPIVVLLAVILTVVVNVLANALPINGQTSAEISNRVPILFVPANYVFSIWGLIYTLLIGFAVYQALPAQREHSVLRRITAPFLVASAANILWIFSFHYNQFPLSMVFMVALLASLIIIYRTVRAATLQGWARVWVQGAFSVYLGWITVATVANAAYVLYTAGWDGFGIAPATWTIVMLVVATAITAAMIVRHRDWAYAAVILWALVGIVNKQADTQPVAITAALMAGAVVVLLVGSAITARRAPALPARA